MTINTHTELVVERGDVLCAPAQPGELADGAGPHVVVGLFLEERQHVEGALDAHVTGAEEVEDVVHDLDDAEEDDKGKK